MEHENRALLLLWAWTPTLIVVIASVSALVLMTVVYGGMLP